MVRCPKCGSDQVVNDECLKCGVLISKAHTTTSTGMKPISYVPPETTGAIPEPPSEPPPTWRPSVDPIASIPLKPRKRGVEKLVYLLILLFLIGGGYKFYRYLKHKASAYSGYYRNDMYYFTVTMPKEGWNHFQSGDLKAREFKDAHDAFYRGDDLDDPEVTMLIWSEGVQRKKVPRRFDEPTAEKMLSSIQDEIITRMEGADLECEITEAGRREIGGNDGFVVHANVTREDLFMKTIIYCGFAETRAYTIQFLGNEEKITEIQPEIERIMDTFGFDIRFF
jgi:hypothetical protein